MSTINVTNLKGRGGASPNLPDGANITGVVTATSFDGSLKTTGTPTLGLGVTINSSGVVISGVATAGVGSFTTLYGDGSNLTGVGETIAPWHYNPDINDVTVPVSTGIGLTFNKKVEAGSGTATLKIVNAGAAGTTIQSWGVSSCTFNVTALTMGALVSNLTVNQTYQFDIPSGFIVDSNETSYAGTAFTFTAQPADRLMFVMGHNSQGDLGLSNLVRRSSPTQLPGGNWGEFARSSGYKEGRHQMNVKTDGTLWGWGQGNTGQLGTDQGIKYSSPVQIGSDTTWKEVVTGYFEGAGTKTDGTLWVWGYNNYGGLGQNNRIESSSPVQIPGTTWDKSFVGYRVQGAIKTNGTLWVWGQNQYGALGQNNVVDYSSPVQVPGTNWRTCLHSSQGQTIATKTDGTLWGWGNNGYGPLGQNNRTQYSSPVQVPGTNWSEAAVAGTDFTVATKTDGTLWAWGSADGGCLGQNAEGSAGRVSSPVQVPGTTWPTQEQKITVGYINVMAVKTDGTLWVWGHGTEGQLGQNQNDSAGSRSSPTQIPGTDWDTVGGSSESLFATQLDTTP